MHPVKHITTSRLDVAYLEYGAPSDYPVVLLHGWPDDALTWNAVTPQLAKAGYRVIVPYLRGAGPTRFLSQETPRSGQLSALGADAVEFVDALGLQRFAVAGHDWGARAAAILAAEVQAQQRISHLCMLSVGYGTNSADQVMPLQQVQNYWYHWYMALPRGEALVRNERDAFTRYIWSIWAPDWAWSEPEFLATAQSFHNPDWADVVLHSYRHRWAHAEGDPAYDAIERRLTPAPRIHVPTLVLHGAADPVNLPSTSDGKQDFFSGFYARTLLPGVGHFPQRERPDAVAKALIEFFGTPHAQGT